MTQANFNDVGIDKYLSAASESVLDSFVNDLKSNFDSAVTSRFQMDSKYQTALKNTRREMKEFITDAIEHFAKLKEKYGSGTFSAKGFGTAGDPHPPDALTIGCKLIINGGIHFSCTITKD